MSRFGFGFRVGRNRFTASISAPVNTVLPAISGTARQGQTLSASTGSWDNSPTSFAYQWRRDGSPIVGALGQTYLLVFADVGAVITCTVTATNGGGSAAATSAGTSAVMVAVPTDISIAWQPSFPGGSVAENAADSGSVLLAVLTGVGSGTLSFAELTDADGKFTVTDNGNGTANLNLSGILDRDLASSHSVTVRLSNAGGNYDETFTINVAHEVDPNIASVVLLAGGDDVNGSLTFRDEAQAFPWRHFGGPFNSTATKKYGAGSFYFDGVDDAFILPDSWVGNSYDFPGDFTIEAWVRLDTGATGGSIITKWSTTVTVAEWRFVIVSGQLRFDYYDNGTNYRQLLTSSSTITADGLFHHVAVSRNGTVWRLFIDGAQVATTTNSHVLLVSTAELQIGATFHTNPNFLKGWIDELRVTKGVGRYTGNFTPSPRRFPRPAADLTWRVQHTQPNAATIAEVNARPGDVLVALMAADNSGTAGASTLPVVSDSAGNVWTQRENLRQSPGNVVNDGVTLHMWTCEVTTAIARGTVSWTFGTTPLRVATALHTMAVSGGETRPTATYKRKAAGAVGNANPLSAGLVFVDSVLRDHVWGATALQMATAPVNDADTTGGAWSAQGATSNVNTGVDATSVNLSASVKKPSASGDQEYNPSFAYATHRCAGAIVIGLAA